MGLDPAEVVRWEHRPQLRQPILIAAFEGWSDASDASTLATRYLAETWSARRFATLDPEEFFDFTVSRPTVRQGEGNTRRVEWPETLLMAAPIPGQTRDVVIVRGVEPQLRWRGFCQTVLGVADELKVELVLTLGALLADVPHTRPVPILGTTVEPSLARQFGLELARYEGPTGIVGVLHDACARAGRLAAGYWASVPHYVHQVSSPKAALALVEAVGRLVGAQIDTGELRLGAEAYDIEVNQRVADDEDAAAYVAQLEEAADRTRAEEAERTASSPLASGDQLAAEAERFLRNHNLE